MLEEVKEKDATIQNLTKLNQTYQNEINNLKTQILKLKIIHTHNIFSFDYLKLYY